MARIPDDVVNCPKSEVSLEHLSEAAGIELKRRRPAAGRLPTFSR